MIKVSPSWACWCQKKNIVLLNHLITRLVLNIRLLWLSIHITLDHLEFSLVHLPASNPGGCCCPLHYWAPGGDFSYGRHSFSCGCCVLRGWNRVGARKCLFIHHPRAGRTSRNHPPFPSEALTAAPLHKDLCMWNCCICNTYSTSYYSWLQCFPCSLFSHVKPLEQGPWLMYVIVLVLGQSLL